MLQGPMRPKRTAGNQPDHDAHRQSHQHTRHAPQGDAPPRRLSSCHLPGLRATARAPGRRARTQITPRRLAVSRVVRRHGGRQGVNLQDQEGAERGGKAPPSLHDHWTPTRPMIASGTRRIYQRRHINVAPAPASTALAVKTVPDRVPIGPHQDLRHLGNMPGVVAGGLGGPQDAQRGHAPRHRQVGRLTR